MERGSVFWGRYVLLVVGGLGVGLGYWLRRDLCLFALVPTLAFAWLAVDGLGDEWDENHGWGRYFNAGSEPDNSGVGHTDVSEAELGIGGSTDGNGQEPVGKPASVD